MRLLCLLCFAACATAPSVANDPPIAVAFTSDLQMASVAATRDGRIFVATPQWGGPRHVGVSEVVGGQLVPYPDEHWNAWDGKPEHAAEQFVCAHAVVADGDALWVVDPASPEFSGAIADGLKLVKIDLATNRVARVWPLGAMAPKGSYVQDVRIDAKRNLAYLADAMGAALITLDIGSGRFRRFSSAAQLRAEPGYAPWIGGFPWLGGDLKPPRIGVDGLEYDPAADVIWFHPLTGATLYRVPAALLGVEGDDAATTAAIEAVAKTGAADGMLLDSGGAVLVTSLEEWSIKRVTARGEVSTVARDERLSWPDTIARMPDGSLLVTASQIHRGAAFNQGTEHFERPFSVFRVRR